MLAGSLVRPEAHEELGPAAGGLELEQARVLGRAGRGDSRGECGAGQLAGVVGGRGLGGRRGRVLGAEALDAPEDNDFFMAGAGEDTVAEEGNATKRIRYWVACDGRGGGVGVACGLPVNEAAVNFGTRKVRVIHNDRGIGMFLGQVRECPLRGRRRRSAVTYRKKKACQAGLTRLITWSWPVDRTYWPVS